jgi:hypothetical protein
LEIHIMHKLIRGPIVAALLLATLAGGAGAAYADTPDNGGKAVGHATTTPGKAKGHTPAPAPTPDPTPTPTPTPDPTPTPTPDPTPTPSPVPTTYWMTYTAQVWPDTGNLAAVQSVATELHVREPGDVIDPGSIRITYDHAANPTVDAAVSQWVLLYNDHSGLAVILRVAGVTQPLTITVSATATHAGVTS